MYEIWSRFAVDHRVDVSSSKFPIVNEEYIFLNIEREILGYHRCFPQETLEVKCPECRAEHRIPYNGVQAFPTNVTLQRFLELHIEITGELPDPTSVSKVFSRQIYEHLTHKIVQTGGENFCMQYCANREES
ncbi:hypothetical protein GQX74_014001 [Glossina fuscipes]|nr:hypothetical protein GQX74_014001 [Glossina fuscipes]